MSSIKASLEKKLHDFNNDLTCNLDKCTEIGLLSGKMGVALFFYYYSMYFKEYTVKNKGSFLLEEICECINTGFNIPTFCSGISGIGWGMDILNEEGLEDIDTNYLFSDMKQYVSDSLNFFFKKNKYDFLHGYLGVGFFLLNRLNYPNSSDMQSFYIKKLEEVIAKLNTTAVILENQAYWVISKEEKEESEINLSLSHGMASIINFLSRVNSSPYFKGQVVTLLNKACRFLISIKHIPKSEDSYYGNHIFLDKFEKKNSRLAWCYGDLGIGISLWHAAISINDKNLFKEAMLILKHSANRRDTSSTLVKDGGLCHGAFGVMHIFDFLYKKTGVKDFKNASEFWLLTGLETGYHENGLSGFLSWNPDENGIWKVEVDILDGISGIGLAIISYLFPKELKWNKCLLIG